jgi:hypothetical protein
MSLNKKIAEGGLTQEPCPLRQNHVIIHSGTTLREIRATTSSTHALHIIVLFRVTDCLREGHPHHVQLRVEISWAQKLNRSKSDPAGSIKNTLVS